MTSVQVLEGPGVVARFGNVLLWMEPGRTGDPAVVGRLLDLARDMAEEGSEELVGAGLADVLNRDPAAVPALVLVVPSAGGLRVVVHGWGRVVAGDVDIDGGWVDREVPWSADLAVGRGGDLLRGPRPGSELDLRRGSTPGGGAAATLSPAPVAPGAPSSALPAGAVMVQGVLCVRGHFNNPEAVACRTCAVGLSQDERTLSDGIRPTLGTLVLDDGTAFALNCDYVIGSAPDTDPAVAGGDVHPIALSDPTGQVARVHAEVRLVGWDVLLVALAPALILAPGSPQWAPAPPAEPSPLPPGTSVALGPRTFSVARGRRGALPPGPPSSSGRPFGPAASL